MPEASIVSAGSLNNFNQWPEMKPTAISTVKKVADVIKMEGTMNTVDDRLKIQKDFKRLGRNDILQKNKSNPMANCTTNKNKKKHGFT